MAKNETDLNITGFITGMREHLGEVINPASYYSWINKNTTLNGVPFTCDRYPFQRKILEDMSTNLSCIKCSQIGLTELQLRKALALVTRNPYRNLIYTLPDRNMRQRVYQGRMKSMIEDTPAFNPPYKEKPSRSMEITQIGSSFLMLFPANEEAATSQPADIVFNDEVDLSDQQVLSLFNSRMQGSDWRMNQKFSTPTYTAFGISASYEISDQHQYLFKCPHCNHWQMPTFSNSFIRVPGLPDGLLEDFAEFDFAWVDKYNIDITKTHAVCEACERPVEYGDPAQHNWVSKFPSRGRRGYRVTPFSTSQLTPAYILSQLQEYKLNDNMKGFKNTVLGIEHEDAEERLPEALLRERFTGQMEQIFPSQNSRYGETRYFIGIDMGSICHITVGCANSIAHVETVHFQTVSAHDLAKTVETLNESYKFSKGFIDRMPLITDAEKVRDATHKVIMPMMYVENAGPVLIDDALDEYQIISYVKAQRTPHLDKLVNAIKAGRLRFSGYGVHKDNIIFHLRDMVRKVMDENGEKMPRWVKMTKNDHWFHSLGYMYQAVYQFYEGADNFSGTVNTSLYLGGASSNIMQPRSSLNLIGGK